MILLRPTRLNVYRAGLVDAVTGSSFFYTFARSVKFTLSHMAVKSLVDYWAGYIRAQKNQSPYSTTDIIIAIPPKCLKNSRASQLFLLMTELGIHIHIIRGSHERHAR